MKSGNVYFVSLQLRMSVVLIRELDQGGVPLSLRQHPSSPVLIQRTKLTRHRVVPYYSVFLCLCVLVGSICYVQVVFLDLINFFKLLVMVNVP